MVHAVQLLDVVPGVVVVLDVVVVLAAVSSFVGLVAADFLAVSSSLHNRHNTCSKQSNMPLKLSIYNYTWARSIRKLLQMLFPSMGEPGVPHF